MTNSYAKAVKTGVWRS